MPQVTIKEALAEQAVIKERLSALDSVLTKLAARGKKKIEVLGLTFEIEPDQIWAGTLFHKDKREGHHFILLPDEARLNWNDGKAWAAELDADLPSRPEQAILFADFKDKFQKEAYWSNKAYEDAANYAWYQGFGYGGQSYYDVDLELLCSPVRRLTFNY